MAKKSPTVVGMDQERLIRQVVLDVAATQLGVGEQVNGPALNAERIRERITWTTKNGTWTVTWFRPNTHPMHVGDLHVPDFDFWINGHRMANLESKNWQVRWLLSLQGANEKIVSRVTGRPVELGNILVISELLCQHCAEEQVLELLRQYRFKVLLTHRQAEGPDDEVMYEIIRTKLEPILAYVFTLKEPRPDWALFSIATKPACLAILVLSMTPSSHIMTIMTHTTAIANGYSYALIGYGADQLYQLQWLQRGFVYGGAKRCSISELMITI
jgi:hypothetical protein